MEKKESFEDINRMLKRIDTPSVSSGFGTVPFESTTSASEWNSVLTVIY